MPRLPKQRVGPPKELRRSPDDRVIVQGKNPHPLPMLHSQSWWMTLAEPLNRLLQSSLERRVRVPPKQAASARRIADNARRIFRCSRDLPEERPHRMAHQAEDRHRHVTGRGPLPRAQIKDFEGQRRGGSG